MSHRLAGIISVLLCFGLLTSCGSPSSGQASIATQEETTIPTVSQATEETTTVPVTALILETEPTPPSRLFLLDVQNPNLAVYSGPGYHHDLVNYITDQGTYSIIQQHSEQLTDGSVITWGKLENGGWINLAEAAKADIAEFESYLFHVSNQYLPIYAGPGYHYAINDYEIGIGTYTIVDESVQYFNSGLCITWGKLKSGAGWICLEDAVITEGAPPFRCTNCGRADVYVSRYGLCDPCHKETGVAQYGNCSVCGFPLNGVEVSIYDGKRCFSCHICDKCGVSISEDTFVAVGLYLCIPCYETMYCRVCGADCTDTGTTNGMCSACHYSSQVPTVYCSVCGTDCSFRGTMDGMCDECYEAVHPTVYCQFCGQSGDSWDTDDVCDNCEGTPCNYCGGPLNASHDCDDYPNVFCPNCPWRMHTTSVGTDGFTCPECGTHFFP